TFIHLHQRNGQPFSITWSGKDSPETDEVRTAEPFSAIEVSGNIELTLDSDTTKQITVTTQQDYLPNVITKVENGVLHIYAEKIFLNRTVKVHVPADSVRSIKATGACKVTTASSMATPEFDLRLTGACQADMDLQVAGLCKIDLTGASQANLSGTCSELKVDGTGACQLEAHDLISKTADVRVSGASQAEVYASERLDATATGASQVDCKGSPKNVNKNTHIGSEINVE
ncbi:MAG TPA: head GIN domain-containing protein, partial [Paludibacter sp.]